jgi:tRNA/tmRNA/rRNA uracil-C5-methylase (TrmA/RlmC/RlmD family)
VHEQCLNNLHGRDSIDGVKSKDMDIVKQRVDGFTFQFGINDFFQVNPEVMQVR